MDPKYFNVYYKGSEDLKERINGEEVQIIEKSIEESHKFISLNNIVSDYVLKIIKKPHWKETSLKNATNELYKKIYDRMEEMKEGNLFAIINSQDIEEGKLLNTINIVADICKTILPEYG